MEIIITNFENKMNILKNTKALIERRFFSLTELKKKLFGYLTEEGIYYIYNKYKYNIPFIFNLKKYLPIIDINTKYNTKKLESLRLLKEDLINNKYYLIDNTFINYLKEHNLKFINIDIVDDNKLLLKYLDDIKVKYTISNKEIKDIDSNLRVSLVNNIEEEVYYNFNIIEDLLSKGVKPSQIHIVNTSNSYYSLLKRIAHFYKVDINIKPSLSVIDKEDINLILNNIDRLDSILEEIKDLDLYKIVINYINTYNLINIKDNTYREDLLIYLLRNRKYSNINYKEAINISSIDTNFTDNDYIFLFNFNQDFPGINFDYYFSDEEREFLGLSSFKEYSNTYLNKAKIFLTSQNKLFISRPKIYLNEDNFKSIIGEELNIAEEYKENTLSNNRYLSDLYLTASIDDYINYNIKNDDLYKYDLSHLKYNSYDNKYKPFKRKLEDNVRVSYSSLKVYFNCAFHYYLDYVLKISNNEDSLATNLGTYVHAVLEASYKEGFNLEETKASVKEKMNMDAKTRFYAKRFDLVLDKILSFNNTYETDMSLSQVSCEEKWEINHNFLTLVGKIDKIRYLEMGNDIYLAIYDYKTGRDEASLANIEDGFNMQLPTYLYLLTNQFKDKEVKLCGLYLQKVTIDSLKEDGFDSFKLQGYTNPDYASFLDKNYQNSSYIKGLKVKKDGTWNSYAKVFSEDDIKNIVDIVRNNLEVVEKSYINNDFPINPKYIGGNNKACTYCPYTNICYRKFEDRVELEKKEFEGSV